jgi:hypothetical protein
MNYAYFILHGTTFSGLSTRTTMGNTWRSLLYIYYYLHEAGIYNAWKRDDLFVMASGDDVCIFCHPRLTDTIQQSVLSKTTRSKDDVNPTGLGQCVTDVKRGTIFEIEFCSKWFYSPTGLLRDLTYSRDVSKILCQK